jgi:aminocarboxymuconate-semialdehyde decarboxylase
MPGRTVARRLLPDLRRGAGAPADAEDLPGPRRRRFPYTIGRIEHGFNMRPDLVATDNPRNPRDYLGPAVLRFVGRRPQGAAIPARYGRHRAGDAGDGLPVPAGEQAPGAAIAALGLDEAEQARLFHGTALEWLGLPASRFA